jgi:hypothetical protein
MKRVLITLLFGLTLIGAPAMATEEPPFRSVLRDGAFEVRDYPALTVADVTVPGHQKSAVNRGFRILAGYIFGANAPRQKIAMTAPVVQSRADAHAGGEWTIRFTMPAGLTLETLPKPDDSHIRLSLLAPGRFAVVRFSGLANPGDVQSRTAALLAWAKARHLHTAGPVSLALYDPPWTPWFMRRNEVMIPVAG